jgi:hypothetical protein
VKIGVEAAWRDFAAKVNGVPFFWRLAGKKRNFAATLE